MHNLEIYRMFSAILLACVFMSLSMDSQSVDSTLLL